MNTIWTNILDCIASVRAYRRNRIRKPLGNPTEPAAASLPSNSAISSAEPEERQNIAVAAAGLAHDINNLLALIIGNSQLALQETLDAAAHRRWAEMLEAGQLASELTRQLVALGRPQVLEVRPVSPNSVIREFREMLARLAGDRVIIKTSLSEDVGLIRVNSIELLQVVMNLVLNARDAMPSGGTLAIETVRKCLAGAPNPAGPRAGCYVVLSVTDTGTGIDEVTKSRVFDAFFSTKAASQTTGLGLAIVAAVMRRSGGHIDISTKVASGTAFHLYFPALDPLRL